MFKSPQVLVDAKDELRTQTIRQIADLYARRTGGWEKLEEVRPLELMQIILDDAEAIFDEIIVPLIHKRERVVLQWLTNDYPHPARVLVDKAFSETFDSTDN